MSVSTTFKRGTTFAGTATYVQENGGPANLLSTTITSDVITVDGNVYHTTITKAGDGLSFTIYYGNTATWALGAAKWDIKFSEGGVVWYTQTLRLNVIDQVTD